MMAKSEPCPAGIDPRDWRMFLARIEHAKLIAADTERRGREARLAAAQQRRPW
jgi:hypothetical protein